MHEVPGMAKEEIKLAEDWNVIEQMLPKHWEQQGRVLGAFRRGRQIPDVATLLRVLLIHLAQGCGLRETAVRAREGGLAEISDVAVLKRLKGCGAWFEWMAGALRKTWLPPAPAPLEAIPRRIRLVDGTMVSEPGSTGSQWRLHYSIELPGLHCDEVITTTPKDGETLKRFTVRPGDILIGDRGYAHPGGIAHARREGGDVIIRSNLVTLPLYDSAGRNISALTLLRELKPGDCADWPVQIKHDKQFLSGRLCGIKKSEIAAEKARQRATRESQRGGTQIRPETLEAAGYVFVFTTLDTQYAASTVMELYRGRWQIELAFKRLKSLVQLGHLKKHDETAARAWLQGKLLVALLIDVLLLSAERFSPWGYPVQSDAPSSMPLAGNLVHA